MENHCSIQKLISRDVPFSAKDAAAYGISSQMLAYFCRTGKIERMCRGVYIATDAKYSPFTNLQMLVKKNTDFVVCLLSALQIHGFTTQLSNSLWIAIRQGGRTPKLDGTSIEYMRLTEKPYSYGIEERDVDGVKIKVYSAAKTVADCFKFRNKIGVDVALEALKEGHRMKLFTNDELWKAAKVCRVEKIIQPYQEILLS